MFHYTMKELLQEAFAGYAIADFSVEHRYHASPIFVMGNHAPVHQAGHHDIALQVTLIGPKNSLKYFQAKFNTARCLMVTDNTPLPYYFAPDDPQRDIGRYDITYQLSDMDSFMEELKDYEYKLYSKEFDKLMDKELEDASDSE